MISLLDCTRSADAAGACASARVDRKTVEAGERAAQGRNFRQRVKSDYSDKLGLGRQSSQKAVFTAGDSRDLRPLLISFARLSCGTGTCQACLPHPLGAYLSAAACNIADLSHREALMKKEPTTACGDPSSEDEAHLTPSPSPTDPTVKKRAIPNMPGSCRGARASESNLHRRCYAVSSTPLVQLEVLEQLQASGAISRTGTCYWLIHCCCFATSVW